MTHEKAKAKAEDRVWCDMTEGDIMCACDVRGFKYRTKRDGHFAAGERSRCEKFLIDAYTKEMEDRV